MEMDKKIKFEIKQGDSIQTDFTEIDPIQRVVRISSDGKLMVTGGTDGKIRLWNFPQMIEQSVLKGHSKEIDDLDFSPNCKHLISIAKDGLGIIWDLTTGKESLKLSWNSPENIKYLFKRCRYSIIEDNKNKFRLFTIANPLGKTGSKQKCFLQQWNPDSGELNKCAMVDESIAALAVRDDGRFLAIGTMFTGSVSIYIAFSLQVKFKILFI